MVVGVVVTVVGLTVVAVLLSRMENRNKANLEHDREPSKKPDIFELVNQEVREVGIASLPGADGVDPVVLLKVWKRDSDGCTEGHGRFVLDDGTAPDEADEETLRFECGREPGVAS